MRPNDLTPVVDALLRPWSARLGRNGITAGMVLGAGTALSVAAGAAVASGGAGRWLMWVLLAAHGVWLVTLRLGALLEREQHGGSPRLAVLREVPERTAELALLWPLASVAGLEAWLVTLCAMLALLCEVAGMAGLGAGGERGHEGPMDAAARLGAGATVCLLLGLGIGPGWWTSLWFQVLPFLLGWTIVRRLRRAVLALATDEDLVVGTEG